MNLLEEIRLTETPGKRGGEFFYAQVVYAHFSEIEKLKTEGFTLATIYKFLEKKEVLPIDSDTHSFRRAFRREIARRQRVVLKEENANSKTKKTINTRENISKQELSRISEKQEPEVSFTPVKARSGRPGLQVNPDNTFRMKPIDPDDLPDIN